MSKKLKIGLISAGVIIVVLFILKASGLLGGADSPEVSIEKAQMRTITEIISANGKIRPETEVKISSDVSGEIVELSVTEGQEIKQGELLLKIKPDIYLSSVERANAGLNQAKAQLAQARARLIQAEASFEQAKLSYERNKKLYEQKTISQAEFEQSQTNFKSAKAETEAAKQTVNAAIYTVKSAAASLKETRENLDKTSIYAPMTGTVSRLNVEKGERVVGTMQMAGTELLRIAKMDKMEVITEVNENDIVKVSHGDTAIIEVDAYLGKKFKGVVSEIANSSGGTGAVQISSEDITNFEVKILLLPESYADLLEENPEKYPFRPGMSATADIQTKTLKNILTVPIKAVTTREDTASEQENKLNEQMVVVFKYKENETVDMQQVETGIQDDEYIQVLEGLEEGDEVVTDPYNMVSNRLRDKQQVQKVEKEKLYTEK
jgi:HlyD family secretion protein